jgi:hypothetical protein
MGFVSGSKASNWLIDISLKIANNVVTFEKAFKIKALVMFNLVRNRRYYNIIHYELAHERTAIIYIAGMP